MDSNTQLLRSVVGSSGSGSGKYGTMADPLLPAVSPTTRTTTATPTTSTYSLTESLGRRFSSAASCLASACTPSEALKQRFRSTSSVLADVLGNTLLCAVSEYSLIRIGAIALQATGPSLYYMMLASAPTAGIFFSNIPAINGFINHCFGNADASEEGVCGMPNRFDVFRRFNVFTTQLLSFFSLASTIADGIAGETVFADVSFRILATAISLNAALILGKMQHNWGDTRKESDDPSEISRRRQFTEVCLSPGILSFFMLYLHQNLGIQGAGGVSSLGLSASFLLTALTSEVLLPACNVTKHLATTRRIREGIEECFTNGVMGLMLMEDGYNNIIKGGEKNVNIPNSTYGVMVGLSALAAAALVANRAREWQEVDSKRAVADAAIASAADIAGGVNAEADWSGDDTPVTSPRRVSFALPDEEAANPGGASSPDAESTSARLGRWASSAGSCLATWCCTFRGAPDAAAQHGQGATTTPLFR
jgi:hypothetical protein